MQRPAGALTDSVARVHRQIREFGDRDRGKNAEDHDDHHQFDDGETFLISDHFLVS